MQKLIFTWVTAIFLSTSSFLDASGPNPGPGPALGLGVIPRSQWWPAEYKEAAQQRAVLLRKGTRRRKAVYSTRTTPAPANDICGYGNRCWVEGSAHVTSYSTIVWHHTDGSQAPNLVAMALYHRAKHFCDLAYHFVIKKNKNSQWKIYQGTPMGYVGSHACGYNFLQGTSIGTVGIAVAGDYGKELPDADLKNVMTKLQDALVKKYHITDIRTHRDGSIAVNDGRDCPGKYMLPFILQLRTRVGRK